MNSLLLIPFFACWGSFLNVLAYRGLRGQALTGRSRCIHCNYQLAWYDLIPVISWLWLKGHCRRCATAISWLYLAVELLTIVSLSALWLFVDRCYFLAYALFFSALIVTFRTDSEDMLIMRTATLYLIPLAFLFSFFNLLPISLSASRGGAIFGYGTLWLVQIVYRSFRGYEGMGQGDLELLATVGAFAGPWGAWISLFIASFLASLCGIGLMVLGKAQAATKLPFGAFLAIAAILYVIGSMLFLPII